MTVAPKVNEPSKPNVDAAVMSSALVHPIALPLLRSGKGLVAATTRLQPALIALHQFSAWSTLAMSPPVLLSPRQSAVQTFAADATRTSS